MGLARTCAIGLSGLAGHLVEVEADVADGVPAFNLVGLPDTSLREAKDRVRAAVANSGLKWPQRRITVNLTPADLPKHGSGFDLAMAVSVLAANGDLPVGPAERPVLVGELGLDGSVRPVRGALPCVVAARRAGRREVVVAAGNLAEAALVPGIRVRSAAALAEVVAHFRGADDQLADPRPAVPEPPGPTPDLADVVGQATGRRAIEVAAAGGHHVYLHGPPGAGKTMLAERLPGILPVLSDDEALEVTAIHSVAGTLPSESPLLRRPPYESPHHSASAPAIVGGGAGLARPGAISRAHRGVLFLDEAPEFASGVLDALRQPLEAGRITLHRAAGRTTYPAAFQLVLAANPCPCATTAGDQACVCTSFVRRRYLARLSGPLLDRVDLHVTLFPVGRAALLGVEPAESTAVVAARVVRARAVAAERLAATGLQRNSEVPGSILRRRLRPGRSAMRGVETALDRGLLSARGMDRVLRVAWTLADLGGVGVPGSTEVDEAMGLRLRGLAA